MTAWRRSSALAVVLVALTLLVQIGIPLTRIGASDGAQRFGWQMFSVAGTPTSFTVHTNTGSEAIRLNEVMAVVRADMPLAQLLPPFLCATVPGATSVTWQDGSHEC